MSDKLRRLIVNLFKLLLLLTPLIWTTNTSELFEFPKMTLVYLFTVVIVALWFSRMIIERKILFASTAMLLPLLIFLGSQIISTLFSINIHTSLFGYYSRFNGGLLSLLAYSLLYFAAVSNLTRSDAKILINTIIVSGIISSLYAFPEHFGHSPSCQLISGEFHARCWVQDVQTRVFGTFGQPNWLAAFLIAIIFIPLINLPSLTASLISVLFFLVLLFTKSRSGLLGFGLGLTVFSILTYKQKLKPLLIGFGLLVVSFVIFGRGISGTTDRLFTLFFPPPTGQQTAADSLPANSLELNITPSSKIRQIVWQGAWSLAKKYPLFGSGVETFAYSYYNVRPVEHNLVSEWDFLYNKAHNEFLNYAATTGFVGLLAYLFFLSSYIIQTYKTIRTARGQDLAAHQTQIALLSGFIALCVSNFFGFSTVPVQLFLFLFPALSYLLTLTDQKSKPAPQSAQTHLLGHGLVILSAGLLIYRICLGYWADLQYTLGKASRQSKSYQTAITRLQNAVKSIPDEPLYTDELSLAASEVAANLAATGKTAEASEAAAIAVELANRTLNLNKVHLNFYKSRAKIFLNLAQVNPKYAIEAAASLDAAIRLAPTDAKLWFNRGLLTEQFGYPKEALSLYQHALALKSNYDLAQTQIDNLTARLATASADTP